MLLYIKTNSGKDIELRISSVQTRKCMADIHGATFEIGDSDNTYHVKDVYAKPSPDTTYGMGLLAFLFSAFATKNFIVSAIFTFSVLVFTKIYFILDKKAVKKFNESNWF